MHVCIKVDIEAHKSLRIPFGGTFQVCDFIAMLESRTMILVSIEALQYQ